MTGKKSRTKVLEALELAYAELNAIRARDGAPQHIDWYRGQPMQNSSCTEEWFDEVCNKVREAIDDVRKEKQN